jgi:hypothetical protein
LKIKLLRKQQKEIAETLFLFCNETSGCERANTDDTPWLNWVKEQQLTDNTNLGGHAGDDHLDDDKGTQEDERMSRNREFTAAEVVLV